jgi:hypothetical protein
VPRVRSWEEVDLTLVFISISRNCPQYLFLSSISTPTAFYQKEFPSTQKTAIILLMSHGLLF